jgi:hypothetical protein
MDLHELAWNERERRAVDALEGHVAHAGREHAVVGETKGEVFGHQ